MPKCKCGSYAVTLDPDREVCDVCYYRIRAEKLTKQRDLLIKKIRELGEPFMECATLGTCRSPAEPDCKQHIIDWAEKVTE